MKKCFALLLCLAMLLALCACGAETVQIDVSAQTTEEEAPAAAEDAAPAAEETASDEGETPPEKPADDASGEASDASDIPAEPIAAEDQAVPDHAESVEVELPADAVYLAFSGDEHGETSGYRVWVEDILGVYGDQLVMLNYSGDVCDKNWEESTYTTFRGILDELMDGKYNVTTGNQEWKSGAPGDGWNDLGDGFTIYGEVAATDTYRVYNIGAMTESYLFPEEELTAIDEYLAGVPADVPVFVLSHYPLHLACATDSHSIPGTDHRQTENNGELIDILNQYPNVIFLWGHNHTFQDPRYGTICPAGAKMTWSYEEPTDKKEINFTYANYGSFCRGDSYGLMAEVLPTEDGVQVTLTYIDTNVAMTTKDSAVLSYTADGVTAEVTEGTGIDYDEILAMSGYADDANFMEEFR